MPISTEPALAPPVGAGVSRRRVAAGAAWAVPVITLASAAPSFAASPCVLPLPSWSSPLWSLSTSGSNSGGCATNLGSDGKWWQWCDGAIGGSAPYTTTRCTTFQALAAQKYTLTFTTMANSGNPVPDSPANLVLTIGGTQYWAGYTKSSTGATGNPGGTNTHLLSTGQGGGANYTNQTWTVAFTPVNTGTVNVCFKWTAFVRASPGSTDDIGTTVPTLACA